MSACAHERPSAPRSGFAAAALLFLAGLLAFPEGTQAEEGGEKAKDRNEWVVGLCVFQAEQPLSWIAGAFADALAASLETVRSRVPPAVEVSARKLRSEADRRKALGATLSALRTQRDSLFFKGYPEWKYRKELAALEIKIGKAEEALAAAERTVPAGIGGNGAPAEGGVAGGRAGAESSTPGSADTASGEFESGGTSLRNASLTLYSDDSAGTLLPAPAPEDRYAFCVEKGIDVLVTGKASAYYDAVLVSVSLYSRWVDRELWTKEFVYSPKDPGAATDAFVRELTEAVSGERFARIRVFSSLPSADVSVGDRMRGQGSSGAVYVPPGEVSVGVSDRGAGSFSTSFSLVGGETLDLSVVFPEREDVSVALSARDRTGAELSLGSLWIDSLWTDPAVGHLTFPKGSFSFVDIIASDGGTAWAALDASRDGTAILILEPPTVSGSTPVEDARKGFYRAFGRFLVVMPVAYVATGMSRTYILGSQTYPDRTDLSSAMAGATTVATVGWIVAGVALTDSVVRFVRYLSASGARSARLVQPTGDVSASPPKP